jgi:hypothetical protein
VKQTAENCALYHESSNQALCGRGRRPWVRNIHPSILSWILFDSHSFCSNGISHFHVQTNHHAGPFEASLHLSDMYKSLSATAFVAIAYPFFVLSPSLIVLLPCGNVGPTPVDKGSLTALEDPRNCSQSPEPCPSQLLHFNPILASVVAVHEAFHISPAAPSTPPQSWE